MSTSPTHVELFAVQPRVSLEDSASPEAFTARHRALAERIEALRARGPEAPARGATSAD